MGQNTTNVLLKEYLVDINIIQFQQKELRYRGAISRIYNIRFISEKVCVKPPKSDTLRMHLSSMSSKYDNLSHEDENVVHRWKWSS